MKHVGEYCKQFRLNELNMTLKDIATDGNIKTISSFEHGKSTNMKHLFKYVDNCQDYKQKLNFFIGLIDVLECD